MTAPMPESVREALEARQNEFLFEPVTGFEDDAAKYRRELFYDSVWAVRVTRPAQFVITDVS